MAFAHQTVPPSLTRDEEIVRRHGYEPKLARRMGPFGNFAISFSVISILSGCMTLYGFGMGYGGPAVMMWGWIGVGAMVLTVACALAEVTSAYPLSGALYYMADRLGGPKWGWYTGVLNLLGLLGGIAGIDYGAATFTGAFASRQWGMTPTPGKIFLIFLGILALHALLNLLGVHVASLLNSVSVWWHLAGVGIIVGALWLVPSHHQSVSFVFTHYVNNTGWHSTWYVTALGLLLAQYTFSGYDASAHLSEETRDADVSAAKGIVRSVWVSWVAGLMLLAGLTFAIKDYGGTLASATGVPPAQIFLDALGTTGAKILLAIVIVAQLFCGNAEVAACSRMVYAFSRDGAMPGSKHWQHLSQHPINQGTPTRAVLLSVVVAGALAVPALWSSVAYAAITSINVVGITPAYAIPIYLRLRAGRRFARGPWHLGRWSRPVGVIAVAWVAVVTVLFCLPQTSPITGSSFNYAPVALAIALIGATLWWPVARRAYQTPAMHSSPDQVAAEQEVI